MAKRTPDNCKYIRCCGEPGRDSNGKCMGFGHANNDEPIELCKRCVYCTAHEEDQGFRNNRRKDDSMGKTIVVCSNDDCVYRGDNGECRKDIIYLDDLGTCEDSE